MTIKIIVNHLAVIVGIVFLLSATSLAHFAHGDASSSKKTEPFSKEIDEFLIYFTEAVQRLHGVSQNFPEFAGRLKMGENHLYADFIPEINFNDKGEPLSLSIAIEIAKIFPEHPVLRVLRHHMVWSVPYEALFGTQIKIKMNKGAEKLIIDAAIASIKMEAVLLEWQWGAFHASLNPKLTAFTDQFEHLFQPLEQTLKVDTSKPQRPIVLMDYFPLEQRLVVYGGLVKLVLFPFSVIPIPLEAKELMVAECSFVSAPTCAEASAVIANGVFHALNVE